jgi:hypothetical protein
MVGLLFVNHESGGVKAAGDAFGQSQGDFNTRQRLVYLGLMRDCALFVVASEAQILNV